MDIPSSIPVVLVQVESVRMRLRTLADITFAT